MLVAHNATFDVRILLRQIMAHNMLLDFDMIAEFSYTLKVLKKVLTDRKGPGRYTLNFLAVKFLDPDKLQNLFDAISYVTILEKIVHASRSEKNLISFQKSYYVCYNEILESNRVDFNLQFLTKLQGIISLTFLKKLTKHNITYKQIFDLYQNKGSEGIHAMFTEKNNNKIKITRVQKVLSRSFEFLKYIQIFLNHFSRLCR